MRGNYRIASPQRCNVSTLTLLQRNENERIEDHNNVQHRKKLIRKINQVLKNN
ncbi:hypothetical protein [Brochothrix thermosphacta]|uniref:hypothetical protein n=1 Tax=Brochothrix thermosphacta TaxID=2756 RepID=UPI003F9E8D37